MAETTAGASPRATAVVSTWAPLHSPVFRWLWIAVLASNIGTWMQTVGAQWLLVEEPNAETLVSLVQTATMLPILLLALPAGVLADNFDRRRLLLGVQAFQVVVGAMLTVLTAVDRMPPALLLVLTFALGAGGALTVPAWQALIPDLVPRNEVPSASALGAISVNLARAVGPALAGVLIAQIDVAAVFALNAVSFGVFAVALFAWRPGDRGGAGMPERFTAALRAGGRYVRHAPVVRRILLRTTLFVVPASALWALLPVVARERLGLGAGGYGLLLGSVGAGAVAGAFVLPVARRRLSTTRLIVVASLLFAAALGVLAVVRVPAVALLALAPVGVAWIAVLASINAAMQMFLPAWVRARGLSIYQMITFGGQALSSVLWGLTAEAYGVPVALLAAGVLLAAGAATALPWPLLDVSGLGRDRASYWPEPHLVLAPDPRDGPVLVQVTYTVRPERSAEFVAAMQAVRRSRRRTGASRWGLFRDGGAVDRYVEAYLVPSWEEHLRQHEDRLTGGDEQFERRARALADGEPAVAHLFPARPPD